MMQPPEPREAGARYSRQILFPPIGREGQEKIRDATVCVLGCGALGSLQAEALTRAGIGRLRIVDRDTVEFSNLQRQWLFTEQDARDEIPKAIGAERRLRELNQEVTVEPFVLDFTPENAEDLAAGCDLILDGTDNFETRFLMNDVAVKLGIPWVYGAAVGSYGVVMPVDPTRGPCFRCVYPDGPEGSHPTCDVNGVLAATTATVGALQVAAAMRLLTGWADFESRLQTFDVWQGSHKTVSAGMRDPECETCVHRHFEFLERTSHTPVSLCGSNAVQLHVQGKRVNLPELALRLQSVGAVRVNDFALRLSVPKYDVTVFPDGRAIVRGTTDIPTARSVYARLIGS